MTADIEYEILRLGHHGDGIATGPVFAARTLPGERITGELTGERLEGVRIVAPSEHRVRPGCRHYRGCGGCDLQHASDVFVEDWKTGFVRASLAEHGLETAMRPAFTSAGQSRRRATFAVRRTKNGALAGFHARRSDVITNVPDCQVLLPEISNVLPMLETLATFATSRKQTLGVSVTHSPEGFDVLVRNGKPLDGPLMQALGQWAQEAGVARLTWEDETVVVRAQPYQMFDGIRVVPPSGAFLQATEDGQQALLAGVRDAVANARHIVDLFAGCGTFSLPLSQSAPVLAVEGQSDMLKAALEGWRGHSGLKPLEILTRDLFREPLLPDELQQFDAAVLDPPRAGARAQVEQLAASDIPTLSYVSCNPITFARDARILVDAGYRLNWVQVVDQFRWSMHTELVSSFTR